jgi:phosphoenolpyruvate phosphomutase
MRRTTGLSNMLRSPHVEFIMEAHNGLSARIVEEAGFSGIWASGLSISASLGLRDNNEASWTQVLDVVEYMADASTVPILLDADTGYGNFNNVRRLVRKLEQREVAGMCMEDKLFPKSNSFREGRPQPMAPMAEFVGKIRAAKDTQLDPDFCVVARVEALIAGYGLEEALVRAHAYADAGADAVLIHSKLATAFQITAFMEHWDNSCPVVIVPTKYYNTPIEEFERAGISLVIWANHMMRSSITAMQGIARQIHAERSLVNIEPAVAPLAEVFRLQNEDELCRAEARYLPAAAEDAGPDNVETQELPLRRALPVA